MPTSDYFAELLSLNPTGYYKFDENRGTTLFDFTQYARNLVISGTPTLKVPSLCSDWPNGAMKFNSGGDSCGNTFGPSPFASLGAITII